MTSFLFFGTSVIYVNAQESVIQGRVINAEGRTVPGVTVSIFHPNHQRRYSALTDAGGQYIIYGVRKRPSPYFIEVYWGDRLIYRARIQVNGPAVQWDISIQ